MLKLFSLIFLCGWTLGVSGGGEPSHERFLDPALIPLYRSLGETHDIGKKRIRAPVPGLRHAYDSRAGQANLLLMIRFHGEPASSSHSQRGS